MRFAPCLALALSLAASGSVAAPKPGSYWDVDDVRPGMKGVGHTVMKGTKVETFDAEVIGVLKNTSPGRDMVLCRLSGLGLERSGIIAGMSGSPVYVEGKLLGAVAYGWSYGIDPIAGITPFSQMHRYVESFERRDIAQQKAPKRLSLDRPVRAGGRDYRAVAVGGPGQGDAADPEALWMTPLRLPVAASGFTAHSLGLLRDRFGETGLTPVQGGATPAHVDEAERNVELRPGGTLAVALIMGDFDLSAVGTVTHIEGDRVYGWGHPFMTLGGCDLPLLTGYVHTIYPRQSVSFKLGSPLRTVGVINADVSTCVAGWLGRTPDLMPVSMTVRRERGATRRFDVEVVRQPSLAASLVYTALTNSVDMEGDLPEELTAEMRVRVELDGRPPLELHDTFSGASYSGGRAPAALYANVASMVSRLVYNPFGPVRINRVDCETWLRAGRATAEVESVELDARVYAPGETVRGSVTLRPFKGEPARVRVALPLPDDLPEGTYQATVCDDVERARADLRDRPNWRSPRSLEQVIEATRFQNEAKRTTLSVRVPVKGGVGVALGGRSLPDLPPSMVQVLGRSRAGGAELIHSALVSRHPTEWVIQGSDAATFTVRKVK